MSIFQNWPYSNQHELNLDWIIQGCKNGTINSAEDLFKNWPYSNQHTLNLDWILETLNNLKTEISRIDNTVSDFSSDIARIDASNAELSTKIDKLSMEVADLIKKGFATIDLGMTGAKPGQLVSIKTDSAGVPTSYEAVDLPKAPEFDISLGMSGANRNDVVRINHVTDGKPDEYKAGPIPFGFGTYSGNVDNTDPSKGGLHSPSVVWVSPVYSGTTGLPYKTPGILETYECNPGGGTLQKVTFQDGRRAYRLRYSTGGPSTWKPWYIMPAPTETVSPAALAAAYREGVNTL